MANDQRMLAELANKDNVFPEIYEIDPKEPTRKPELLGFFEQPSKFKTRWLFANLRITLSDGTVVEKAAEVRGRKEFSGQPLLNRYVATVSKTFKGGGEVVAGTPKWYVRPEAPKPLTKKKAA